METEATSKSKFHLGRTWWMTILTIVIDAVLGLLCVHGHAEPAEVASPIAAITLAAASHNIGRAIEDAAKNKNGNGSTTI